MTAILLVSTCYSDLCHDNLGSLGKKMKDTLAMELQESHVGV